MSRSSSSHRWLKEHHNDTYVKQAKADGWRARAAYKLLEMDEKYRLLRPGMTVVDLGAAPGSWSQVAAKKVGARGQVLALDILDCPSQAGVDFIQGDFTEEAVYEAFLAKVQSPVDLVLSDMAPNMSGIKDADQAKSMYLAELALDFAQQVLGPKGRFVVKVFQGTDFDTYLKTLRQSFKQVRTYKPAASRDRSRELYLLASEPLSV